MAVYLLQFQQRREVLQSLIKLTQSPTAMLKMLAAHEIPQFFNNFADLEEDAINAIYDLCEDPESKVRIAHLASEPVLTLAQVRIAGYLSIGRISKIDRKWIKRNADVLIQLLQSGWCNFLAYECLTLITPTRRAHRSQKSQRSVG